MVPVTVDEATMQWKTNHNKRWKLSPRYVVVILLVVVMLLGWGPALFTKKECSHLIVSEPQQFSYAVLRNRDINGEDLMHVQANDLEDVKKVCNLFPNCAGFNSNGWLKTKVSDHISGPADIYVKSEKPVRGQIETIVQPSETFSNSYDQMIAKMKIFVYELTISTRHIRHRSSGHGVEHFIEDKLSKSHLRTRNAEEATFFFVPIRCSYYIYSTPLQQDGIKIAKEQVAETIEYIRKRYPYWDRTYGTDHFYICSHSIGAGIGGDLLKNSIALVYSADYENPYFIPHKDLSLPPYPTHTSSFNTDSKRRKLSATSRPVLAFCAGDMASGRIRPTLYSLFATDPTIVLFAQDISWNVKLKYLSQSKFCLIPRGKDVWSSDLMDAVMSGCIPVILSDHYHLPLQGIVNWSEFSIIIPESQVANLKRILISISNAHYKAMREKLIKVQNYFIWNDPVKPYDAFNSIMYELWQRRAVIRYRKK